MKNKEKIVAFIKKLFPDRDFISLHEPSFVGNEKRYVIDCIESTFVSSVGKYVDAFETAVASYTGSKHAIAMINGTAALQLALLLCGVNRGDEVLTQAVTFVATANAIRYCGAHPVFLDSDRNSLGMNPAALEAFLIEQCIQKSDGHTYNKKSGRKIAACLPVHVFGHPIRIDKVKSLCDQYRIVLLEDAAEAIGSLFQNKHLGTFGKIGILSFNGNKTITTGGGGLLLTDDGDLAKEAKHLTTTAKIPHPWNYVHDRIGFNFRLPNINAALGCAQMEMLPSILRNKRRLATIYRDFFERIGIPFISEPENSKSNYWLNAIILENRKQRDMFLEYSNSQGVITRPLWALIPNLPIYEACESDGLKNARWLEKRVVNIPSSPHFSSLSDDNV